MRRFVLIPIAVVIAGMVWVFTVGTLFGALLVLGGIAAPAVLFLPAGMERIGQMLSAGLFDAKP